VKIAGVRFLLNLKTRHEGGAYFVGTGGFGKSTRIVRAPHMSEQP